MRPNGRVPQTQLAYVSGVKKRKQRTYKYAFLSTAGTVPSLSEYAWVPRAGTPLNNNALSAPDDITPFRSPANPAS